MQAARAIVGFALEFVRTGDRGRGGAGRGRGRGYRGNRGAGPGSGPAHWARVDREGIERLLSGRGLPAAGALEHLATFVVACRGPVLLGCAGIERHGDVGLLRSVAVAEEIAGQGVGRALVGATLDRARGLGLRELYLLTNTAVGYFPRFGFEPIGRDALPSTLQASEQLQGACCASAVAMRLTLSRSR